MEMFRGLPADAAILPAVITLGWLVSWSGPARVRWGLLAVAVVVSIVCVVVGIHPRQPPPQLGPDSCSGTVACTDFSGFAWYVAGIYGIVCWFVLLVLTLVIDAVRWTVEGLHARRAARRPL